MIHTTDLLRAIDSITALGRCGKAVSMVQHIEALQDHIKTFQKAWLETAAVEYASELTVSQLDEFTGWPVEAFITEWQQGKFVGHTAITDVWYKHYNQFKTMTSLTKKFGTLTGKVN